MELRFEPMSFIKDTCLLLKTSCFLFPLLGHAGDGVHAAKGRSLACQLCSILANGISALTHSGKLR